MCIHLMYNEMEKSCDNNSAGNVCDAIDTLVHFISEMYVNNTREKNNDILWNVAHGLKLHGLVMCKLTNQYDGCKKGLNRHMEMVSSISKQSG